MIRLDGGVVQRTENESSTPVNRPKPALQVDLSPANQTKARDVNLYGAWFKAKILNAVSTLSATNSTTTSQPISAAEANRRADELIATHGGRGHLDTDAVGEALALMAEQNPSEARAVTEKVLDKIEERDRDEVAQSFVEKLDYAKLRALAADRDGQALLERLKSHLLSGSVHDDERETAGKIDAAIAGVLRGVNREQDIEKAADAVTDAFDYNRNNTEIAAQTLAEQARQLDELYGPGAGAELIKRLAERDAATLTHLLQSAGDSASGLSSQDRATITRSLGAAYASMSTNERREFSAQLVSSAHRMNYYDHDPAYYQNLATVIGNSGSTTLKSDYAKTVIDYVNNPDTPLTGSYETDANALLASAGVAVANDTRAIEDTLGYLKRTKLLGAQAGHYATARFLQALAAVPNKDGDAVLGDFLKGSSRINFADAKHIFEIVSNNQIGHGFVWQGDGYFKDSLSDAPGVKEGLAQFFLSRSDEFLNELTDFDYDNRQGLAISNAETLSNFFRLTTFAEDAPYQGEIIAAVVKHAATLRSKIGDSSLSKEARSKAALQMGRIIGSMIGSYNEAIRDYSNEDANHDRRVKNATMLASFIATAVAGPGASIVVRGGIQGARFALDKILTNNPPPGEKELKEFEAIIKDNFDFFITPTNLDVPGVSQYDATQIRKEVFDGMNEMILAWARGEGIIAN
ncbi:MAG TPA: hypothetical protein VF666_12905 [Pyrinomonadaceae bacterium]|jgi:hypothetical protein